MSEAIQKYNLSQSEITTLVQVGVIPQGTPESAIAMYAKFCSETNLSPFKKQVHLVKRWTKDGDRYTIQTGIDGYRAIANRTGQYAGNDDYRFDEGLTEYEAIKEKRNPPTTATATVYKIVSGVRCSFSSTARWEEYVQKNKLGEPMQMWAKMPYLMLGKCAEALALRKAFPEEIGGVYTDEEMQQAEVVDGPKQPAQSGKVEVKGKEGDKPRSNDYYAIRDGLEGVEKSETATIKDLEKVKLSMDALKIDGKLTEKEYADLYEKSKKVYNKRFNKKLTQETPVQS